MRFETTSAPTLKYRFLQMARIRVTDLGADAQGVHEADFNSIAAMLAELTEGTQRQFWTTPMGSLATAGRTVGAVLVETGTPRTPLEALKAGEYDAVLRCVHGFVGR